MSRTRISYVDLAARVAVVLLEQVDDLLELEGREVVDVLVRARETIDAQDELALRGDVALHHLSQADAPREPPLPARGTLRSQKGSPALQKFNVTPS